ncbi:hypothetical protein MPL3356_270024 [Mesorhizobium plurifarium]|uniref:Uncharacterized protein n=1 Tax=Mesorhizobium plurifarium TaxID=69974 RepID=A0A090DV18_MESPL|nr:hypothetical protein MPL3356_270024 [Mesorhizobium plurifarium]
MTKGASIEIRDLYKIFGRSPERYVEPVRNGLSKPELGKRHGHILGLSNINISIPAGSYHDAWNCAIVLSAVEKRGRERANGCRHGRDEQGGARGGSFVGHVCSAGKSDVSRDLAWRTAIEPGLAESDRCGQLANGDYLDLVRNGRPCTDCHNAARVHSIDLPRAIADNFSRRNVITLDWCMIASSSIMLTALVGLGFHNPWMAFSCLAGCGAAFADPAWHASVGGILKHKSAVPAAVTLIPVGYNAVRSIGPALSIVVVAAFLISGKRLPLAVNKSIMRKKDMRMVVILQTGVGGAGSAY